MRKFLALLLVLTSVFCGASWAAPYPTHPVTLIVPYTPGGSADLLARIVAQALSTKYGQSFVIENRPGAGGHIGAAMVARSAPDGYTLLLGTIPIHSAYKIYPSLPYDPAKDLVPISIIGEFPSLLIVTNSVPSNTVGELIALAKTKRLYFGSAGTGSATHLGAALFNHIAGTDMQHVPYRGSSAAWADLMSGQIQVMFENLPTAIALVQSKRVKAIAVTSRIRSPSLPNVPTVAESGLPNYEFTAWYTIAAPTGVPAPILNQLSTDLNQILHSSALKGKFDEMGVTPVGGTLAANVKFVNAQTKLWTDIIEASNMKVE